MSKKRLDMLLVERKLADSQENAKRLIMAGLVFSKQIRLDKPGMAIDAETPLTVKQKTIPYVGRGGLKLEKALRFFNLDVQQKLLVDVGSSTGGFTDCALQNGVKLSYAIDVGYNQLAWKLRNDKRVVVMERTNFRYVTPDMFKHGKPDIAVIDVSFISLRLIFPVLKTIMQPNSDIIALVKPQFEAKKEQVGPKGLIKDKQIHLEVLQNIILFAIDEGFHLHDVTFSPITGGDGNIEFLCYFSLSGEKTEQEQDDLPNKLVNVINEAHEELQEN